jgi:hypothetical protein
MVDINKSNEGLAEDVAERSLWIVRVRGRSKGEGVDYSLGSLKAVAVSCRELDGWW